MTNDNNNNLENDNAHKNQISKSLPIFNAKTKDEEDGKEEEELVRRIPQQKKIKKATTKLFKKIGLKKSKKVPEVTVTPADPSLPLPKPILKNPKTMLPIQKQNSSMSNLTVRSRNPSDKSMSEDDSESEFPGKKKKVRISEPNEKGKEGEAEIKETSTDANSVENQVLIFHYNDILKEFGSNKGPPKKSTTSLKTSQNFQVKSGDEKRDSPVENPKGSKQGENVKGSPIPPKSSPSSSVSVLPQPPSPSPSPTPSLLPLPLRTFRRTFVPKVFNNISYNNHNHHRHHQNCFRFKKK